MLSCLSLSLCPILTLSWCFTSCFIAAWSSPSQEFHHLFPIQLIDFHAFLYTHILAFLFRVRHGHSSLCSYDPFPICFPWYFIPCVFPFSIDLQILSFNGISTSACKKPQTISFPDKPGKRVASGLFCHFISQSKLGGGERKHIMLPQRVHEVKRRTRHRSSWFWSWLDHCVSGMNDFHLWAS